MFLNPEKNGLIYKCHNCGEPGSFKKFIRFVDESLYKQYLADVLRHSDGYERDQRAKQRHEEEELKETVTKNLSISYLRLKGATPLSELPEDHPAVEYLSSRFVERRDQSWLFYVENFRKFIHKLQPDKFKHITNDSPAIVFPLFGEDGQTLNGVQFRNLDLNDDFRYITIKFNRRNKHFGYHRMSEEQEPSYVVEGPIDSLMLPPGALAVGGSDLVNAYFENAIYIFDNEPRNREIVKKIEEVVARGNRVCLLPEEYYGCDLNDIICKHGLSKRELLNLIETHTSSGLRATMKLSQWRKV